jgi:hypothetical protein
MTAIEHHFTVIGNPGNPGFRGFLAEQLGFIKGIVTGQLEQLYPGISVIRNVAHGAPTV